LVNGLEAGIAIVSGVETVPTWLIESDQEV
jgi:hypothetical protein